MNQKRALIAAVLLAWLPSLVGVAYPAVWQWSQTANTNATADAAINWREGQAPSSVNDSARAMMAALAAYRDDISGLLVAGGTSTAYTVATNQGLCASPSTVPQDGQLLAINVTSTNGAGVTLQADSCGAYPIQTAVGVAVPAGALLNAAPYTLRFSTFASAWLLRDFYGNTLTVPLGALVAYTGTTVPSANFVFPAGQCLSTTTYAAYWALLGSPAAGGCSAGQFQIVDLSGRVPAGLDTMPGFSAAGRLTSSSTGCGTAMTTVGAHCANNSESSTLITVNLPPYTPAGTNNTVFPTFAYNVANAFAATAAAQAVTSIGAGGPGSATITVPAQTFTGTAQGGTSTPFPRVMPVVGVTYLLRVL